MHRNPLILFSCALCGLVVLATVRAETCTTLSTTLSNLYSTPQSIDIGLCKNGHTIHATFPTALFTTRSEMSQYTIVVDDPLPSGYEVDFGSETGQVYAFAYMYRSDGNYNDGFGTIDGSGNIVLYRDQMLLFDALSTPDTGTLRCQFSYPAANPEA